MSSMSKGLLLAALHVALVLSLGGKLLYDRVTRPRVWVLCQVYDPDLPIRGRYLSEQLQFPTEGFTYKEEGKQDSTNWYANRQWAYLEVRNGQLIAEPKGSGSGEWVHLRKKNDGTVVAFSEEPVLVFIPEHAEIPQLKTRQELWVEVTVPAQGPPRPIRIGVKKDDVLVPLKID
jgi:hypothetical protein